MALFADHLMTTSRAQPSDFNLTTPELTQHLVVGSWNEEIRNAVREGRLVRLLAKVIECRLVNDNRLVFRATQSPRLRDSVKLAPRHMPLRV